MPQLYLFNPGHEMEILCGKSHYTPPYSVQKMSTDMEMLPIWYGGAGSFTLVRNPKASQFMASLPKSFKNSLSSPMILNLMMKELFRRKKMGEKPKLPPLEASIWGISPRSIDAFKELKQAGMDIEIPEWKEDYAVLTHRKTSTACLERLQNQIPITPAIKMPEFFTDLDAVKSYIAQNEPPYVIKTPFSSSGRGLYWVHSKELDNRAISWLSGSFKKQRMVSIEPALDRVFDFAAEFYTSKNIVVALAGNISLDTADKWMREFFLPNVVKTTTATKTDKAYTSCARHLDRFKDFEQCNFALGYPTVSFVNKNFNTQAIVNTILGGGMSSRLFQEIREKRGLAYSIYSGGASYSANGSLNIICNTNPKSYTEAKSAALEVMDSVVNDGITEQEFVRAKTQIKSAFVFGQENCQSMMISAGKLMLAADKDFDIAHKIAEMEAVTLDDCNAFVGKYLSGDCICSAYVGKKES